jgi:hypothetical protein
MFSEFATLLVHTTDHVIVMLLDVFTLIAYGEEY